MATRPYEQRRRAESAEQTRTRIVEAVVGHLRRHPGRDVAIDRVAKEAGVARSTVYEVFGSRAGLFDAAAAAVYERAGYFDLLDATSHPDAREHLRGGIAAGTRMLAGDRDVFRSLYSMAALDPESVGGVVGRMEEERAGGMKRLAQKLADQGQLREGLGPARASHVLWVITGFESFDALHTGRGLGVDTCAKLLVEMAESAVCRPA
jgi:AcrR family transcriptional regulator